MKVELQNHKYVSTGEIEKDTNKEGSYTYEEVNSWSNIRNHCNEC